MSKTPLTYLCHKPDLYRFFNQTKTPIMEIFKMIVLGLSGLPLLAFGMMRMGDPIKNYLKNSGIKLDKDVNILNEARGVGSLMFVAGCILALGIFLPKLRLASFVVGTLIFLGFALGRMISLKVDGKPNKLIIQGLSSELVLGILNLIGLITTWQ